MTIHDKLNRVLERKHGFYEKIDRADDNSILSEEDVNLCEQEFSFNGADFKELLKSLKEQNKTGVYTPKLVAVATYLRDRGLVRAAKSLQELHNTHGHFPRSLVEYRDDLQKEILDIARRKLKEQKFAELKDAYDVK